VVGPKAEQRFGHLLFFAGYVVCGTFAYGWMVIAHPLQGPYSFAGGASGAIFGVLAALGVMLLRSSRTRSESALLAALALFFSWQILLAIGPSVVANTIAREIHLGGATSGL